MVHPTIEVGADAEPATRAIALLSEAAQRRSKLVQAFLGLGDPLFEFHNVDAEGAAAAACDVLVRLEPTNRLRVFLAACGAGDLDAV
jgi:hypothetical protein